MTVYAARDELRERGFFRPSALLIVAFTAIWSAGFYAGFAGFLFGGYAFVYAPWILVVLLLAAIFARDTLRVPLLVCGLWTLLVVGSVVAGGLVAVEPLVAVIPAALAVSAWLANWRPDVAVILVFLLSSAFGTISVVTPLPVGPTVDLLIAGLWLNTIWTYFLRGRDRPIWLWPGVIVVGIYLFVTAIEILGAESLTIGLFGFRTIAWYMTLIFLVAYAQWQPGTRESIAKGILLVALAVGAYATLRHVIGPSAGEAALAYESTVTNFVGEKLGLFGSFPSRHELGAWTAVLVPFCGVFALGYRGRWRLIAAAATVLCVVALLGSDVRAAVVAVVVGLGLAFLLFQLAQGFGSTHAATAAVGLVLVAAVSVGAFAVTAGGDETRLNRYEVLLDDPTRDPAFQGRLFKWGTAIDEIDEKPAGHGLGSGGRVQRTYGRFVTIGSINIDNQYLALTFEQGLLVVGLLVVGLLLLLFELAVRSIAVLDPKRATLGIAGAAALASILVLGIAGQYMEGLTALATWLIVGLGVGQFTQPDADAA
jgi:O-antigen ligase